MPASDLRKGDLVVVEAGQVIPGDGEVIEGIASVDESAITGESAPVIRESGGDRSAVTGGTKVLSDRIVIRITVNPGESFLDRMIGLVEGAKRQKTPNEIALHVLLSGMTIIFLIACVTLVPFGVYSGLQLSRHGDRGAAGLPHPHHHRRPALRHRHRRHGPPDPPQHHPHERPRRGGGGRRGHHPARQDGHHHAGQPHGQRVHARARRARRRSWRRRRSWPAWPTRRRRAARSWCWPRSTSSLRARDLHAVGATFVPFTAQTRMSGCDLDGREHPQGRGRRHRPARGGAGRRGAGGGGAGGDAHRADRAARRWPWRTARACWASST